MGHDWQIRIYSVMSIFDNALCIFYVIVWVKYCNEISNELSVLADSKDTKYLENTEQKKNKRNITGHRTSHLLTDRKITLKRPLLF